MKTLFYDDVLRFLYSSEMFQQLTEEAQQLFLNQFARDEEFIKSIAVAVDFQERLGKLEGSVPLVTPYEDDGIRNVRAIQRKLTLKDKAVTKGNVTYIPFHQKIDFAAPLIVGLDTSCEMELYEIQAKGLILPLLELCAEQKRDCIVATINDRCVFPHGELTPEGIQRLQHIKMQDEQDIALLFKQALYLFDAYRLKEDAEFMLITANTFASSDISEQLIEEFGMRGIELSAIALDSKRFEEAPLEFLNKVFFPNG
ncbi:hypothetical protein [Lysinibacillus odysseyi]|uniref:Uncharacterized protein n=1 Tax=Lysinibacillus odysseyi 34hs-1 = NBRC 100172 TaxID=1220589 RepID=A0A0A3I9Y1_9BACI|nr:hypothetical protein [Lysinibacillus odysseyi]KGR81566.1 hypothetical protein CD32_19625 [Lysinibacillus odysseyi 34hs-1 = NBRC 100172]